MKTITAISFIAFAAATILYAELNIGLFLSLSVAFATIFYHLGIRLLIGLLFNRFMKNKADYTKKYYHIHAWEFKLYKFFQVKKWKDKLPTYNPKSFSLKSNSLEDVAQVMCQSELVHTVNAAISFIPLIAAVWFGKFFVFLITSVLAAVSDLIFVIMQRYNRTRIVKLIEKQKINRRYIKRAP